MSQIKTKFITDLAITTAKLDNDSVTNAKIADNAVDSLQIAADAVTNAKIADNAVDSLQIAANAVTTAKIAADAVTGAKIRLDNDESLRARNAGDSADIDIVKVDATDKLQMLSALHTSFPIKGNTNLELESLGAGDYISSVTNDGYLYASGQRMEVDLSSGSQFDFKTTDQSGATANIGLKSGDSSANTSGSVQVASGTSSVGSSFVSVESGAAPSTGAVIARSGAAVDLSGDVSLITGDASAGDSGSVNLSAGIATGVRGSVISSGKEVNSTADTNILLSSGTEIDMSTVLVDMSQSERVRLPVASSDPSGVNEGEAYWNTSSDTIRQYDGAAWKSVATEDYVNGAIGGTNVNKEAVAVVATSNLTLSGEQTIDGVLTSASRILVTGQSTASQNGIYVTGSGSWSRSTDADANAEIFRGMEVYVALGNSHAHSKWVLVTAGPFTLGSTSLQFYKLNQPNKESLTLNGTDITNQYKDFAFKAIPSSTDLVIDAAFMTEGVDYSLSEVGGVTRLTFLNDLATGGASALISGDVLRVKYIIKR